MELVGHVLRTQKTDDDRLQVEFRCTNTEEFYFYAPPAIQPPEGELIRVFTHLLDDEGGGRRREYVLNHWEKL